MPLTELEKAGFQEMFEIAQEQDYKRSQEDTTLSDMEAEVDRKLYDTPIPPERQEEFERWIADQSIAQGRDISRDIEDYDIKGFFLAGEVVDDRGHGTDRFKKPSHPTFSEESIYHGNGNQGGNWMNIQGTVVFVPGRTNKKYWSEERLQDYFSQYEPDVVLDYDGKETQTVQPEDEIDVDYQSRIENLKLIHPDKITDLNKLAKGGESLEVIQAALDTPDEKYNEKIKAIEDSVTKYLEMEHAKAPTKGEKGAPLGRFIAASSAEVLRSTIGTAARALRNVDRDIEEESLLDAVVNWAATGGEKYLKKYDIKETPYLQREIAKATPSLGYSIVTMLAAAGGGMAGAHIGIPHVGIATALTASGTVAYRAMRDQKLSELFEMTNIASLEERNRPLKNEEWKEIVVANDWENLARKTALYEAIPEAAANVLGFKIIRGTAGKALRKTMPSLGKLGEKLAQVTPEALRKAGVVGGRGVGVMASEQTQELFANYNQLRLDVGAGLLEEPGEPIHPKIPWLPSGDTAVEVLKEQGMQVALITAILGPAAHVGGRIYDIAKKEAEVVGEPAPAAEAAPEATEDQVIKALQEQGYPSEEIVRMSSAERHEAYTTKKKYEVPKEEKKKPPAKPPEAAEEEKVKGKVEARPEPKAPKEPAPPPAREAKEEAAPEEELTAEKRAIITAHVEEQESYEAVVDLYPDDTEVGRFARERGREKFGKVKEAKPMLEELVKYPVQSIAVEEIKIHPKDFQFKKDVDERGVQRGIEIKGEYEELAAGNILAWRSEDGTLFCVNGHHRLAKAKDEGVSHVNVQIIKETDGFTRADAMALGAITNIQEGRGTAYDWLEFFKKSKISEAEVRKRGIEGQAYKLAQVASDDLITSFRNRIITPKEAFAIAEAAGTDEAAQAVGMRLVQVAKEKGERILPDKLTNLIKAHIFMKANAPELKSQRDLFGETHDADLELNKNLAKIAEQHQTELKEVINALRNVNKENRLEIMKKTGLEFESVAEALEVLEKAKVDLEKWKRWEKDPDLVKIILAELKGEPKPAITAEVERELDEYEKEIEEEGEIPEPEKRYAGFPLPDFIQKKIDLAAKKLFGKPEGIEKTAWEITKDYWGKTKGVEWKYSDKWHRELKKTFSKAEREDMMFYRQRTGNLWKGKGDTFEDVQERLTPEAKRFVDQEIDEHISNWRIIWNESPFTKDINAREEVIKTYLTGIYAGNVKKAYEYLVGLKGKSFVTKNFMLNKKTYLNFAEAFEEAGLVPRFRDMTDQLNYQDAHMTRLLANNELIGQIHELEKEIGQKLIARSNQGKLYDQAKEEGWVLFDDPWLRAYVAGRKGKKGEKQKPAWATTRAPALVHPELASAIQGVFSKDAYKPENIFWRGYDAVGAHLRYVRVSCSGFHFVPLAESLVGGKGFGALNFPAWIKRGREILDDPVLMQEMIEAGVRLRAPSEVSRHQVEGNIKALINVLEAQGDLKKVAAQSIKAISWLPFKITDFMFGPYLSILKANIFFDYQSETLKGFEKQGKKPDTKEMKEINREVASLVNDQFGVQAWELMRCFNDPKVRKWMHRGIGYPDWSISALRQARAGAETGLRGRLGRRYWFKYGIAFVAMQNAMNYLFTGLYNDEDDEDKIKWSAEKAHSTFENKDPKHNLNFQLPDIELTVRGITFNPGRDEKGRRRYAHFGKQMLEIPRYFTNFTSQMFSKSNPVIQLIFTQLLGGKPYKGELFPARGEYVAGEFKPWKGTQPWTYERMKERLLEAVTSSLPFSIQQISQMGPATAGILPISKGLSLHVSKDYMRKAVKHHDKEMLENIRITLRDNGYEEASINRTMGVIRSDYYNKALQSAEEKDSEQCLEHCISAIMLGAKQGNFVDSINRRGKEISRETRRFAIDSFREARKKGVDLVPKKIGTARERLKARAARARANK